MAAAADTADVGIAFEPIPSRGRIAEIRGTLWLNRATSELRRLDFHYANLSRLQESAGGEMAFARLRDGAWAITRWSIRMPVFDRSPSGQPRLAQVKVAGGELTVAERGGDSLQRRAARGRRGGGHALGAAQTPFRARILAA